MTRAGIDENEKSAGTIVHADHDTVFCNANLKGVQVMPISYALFKYGLEDYSWKLIERDKGRVHGAAPQAAIRGRILHPRRKRARRPNFPCRPACTSRPTTLAQDVHNIIIAEEGSELNVISGLRLRPRTSAL